MNFILSGTEDWDLANKQMDNLRINFIKILISLLLIFIFTFLLQADPLLAENLILAQSEDLPNKVFQLKYLKAKEAVTLIEIFLSKDGRAVADERTNLLIVRDHLKNLSIIEEFLKKYDKAPQNIRINIKIVSEDELARTGFLINWRVINNFWRISILGPKEVETSVYSQMNLLIMNGSSGKISIGSRVPYPHWYYLYTINQGYVLTGTVDFYEVATGLVAAPRIIRNDEIGITIYPYINFRDNNNNTGEINFKKIRTTIKVKNGESVVLGASQSAQNNIITNILSGSLKQKKSQRFLVILTANIVK